MFVLDLVQITAVAFRAGMAWFETEMLAKMFIPHTTDIFSAKVAHLITTRASEHVATTGLHK